jgi:hypothetical protein
MPTTLNIEEISITRVTGPTTSHARYDDCDSGFDNGGLDNGADDIDMFPGDC